LGHIIVDTGIYLWISKHKGGVRRRLVDLLVALQQPQALMQALGAGRRDGLEQEEIGIRGREGSTIDALDGPGQRSVAGRYFTIIAP